MRLLVVPRSCMVNVKFSSHLGSKPIAEFLGLIPIAFFKHGLVFSLKIFYGFCGGFDGFCGGY